METGNYLTLTLTLLAFGCGVENERSQGAFANEWARLNVSGGIRADCPGLKFLQDTIDAASSDFEVLRRALRGAYSVIGLETLEQSWLPGEKYTLVAYKCPDGETSRASSGVIDGGRVGPITFSIVSDPESMEHSIRTFFLESEVLRD
jgi:hypothetical protein